MATNLVNEPHRAIPSIFRLPRNHAFPRDAEIAKRHRSMLLNCVVAPALLSPVRRKSGPRKFQLCACSKTCDQHARTPDWRRLSFSCDRWDITSTSVFGCPEGCGRLSVTKGSFYWHFTDIVAYRAAGVGFLHLAGAHPGTHAAEGRERFLDIM